MTKRTVYIDEICVCGKFHASAIFGNNPSMFRQVRSIDDVFVVVVHVVIVTKDGSASGRKRFHIALLISRQLKHKINISIF